MRPSLTQEQIEAVRKALRRVMKDREPWRSPLLTADLLSRIVGVNAMHLREALRLEGVSFSDFVNGYRLDETLRLKERYPEMTVAEAVAKAGFGSTSSFSSTYKKRYGVTPGRHPRHV